MAKGRRVRGVISGFVCGLGIAVLLQQFGVVPLTTALLVAVPVGMAIVGLALGWPRGPRAAAAVAQPTAASTAATTPEPEITAPATTAEPAPPGPSEGEA